MSNSARGAALVLGALTLLALPARAQEVETEHRLGLDEAVAEALSGNADLAIAVAESRAGEAAALGAAAFRWPHVQVESGITRSTDPVFAFGTKLRQARFLAEDLALDALNDPGPVEDWSTTIGFRWEALSPSRWMGWTAARRQAEAAGWRSVWARQSTELGARILYYDAVRTLALAEAAEAAEAAARATLDRFARRQERGLLTEADRLQAEAELAAATASRFDASRRAREARQSLGVFLGWSPETLPLPTDTLEAPSEVMAIPFDPARRADLRALDSATEARKADARGAGLAFLPAIDAFGQVAARGRDAFDPEDDDWTVGLSLHWTAFAGLSRLAERRRADEALRIARLQRDQALRAAGAEVDAADRAVEATAAAVEAALSGRRAAAAAADLLRRRFEEGLATPDELLQAEARRTAMQGRAIDALASYQVARAQAEFVRSPSGEENLR
jgi:outer membrane protein TolC